MRAELPPIRAVLPCRSLSSSVIMSIDGNCAGDCAPMSVAWRDPLGVDCYNACTHAHVHVTCAAYHTCTLLTYFIMHCSTVPCVTKWIWPKNGTFHGVNPTQHVIFVYCRHQTHCTLQITLPHNYHHILHFSHIKTDKFLSQLYKVFVDLTNEPANGI